MLQKLDRGLGLITYPLTLLILGLLRLVNRRTQRWQRMIDEQMKDPERDPFIHEHDHHWVRHEDLIKRR